MFNAMDFTLIDTCYQNYYEIDLRKYHNAICKISKVEERLINEINKNRIVFEDGISSYFRLILYDNLIYLMGDKTCYPCSNVIQSAYGDESNWVSCILMPGDVKYLGETDIRKSGIIISLFSELVPQISNEAHFFHFIDKLPYSFSRCEWFKAIYFKSLYVRLVTFWDYKQKINNLHELELLYPFELIIYATYQQIEIQNEKILKYFTSSLAESTNRIFDSEEIIKAFRNLSKNQIEEVLAVKSIHENLHMEVINDEYFADLLEIDGSDRYPMFVDGTYYLYHMRERANSIFKNPNYKKVYLKLLKQNFRALENDIRKGKGYESVGSYFMEKLLYEKIKNDFPELIIRLQYSPMWLRPQRLDIFIEECNLGIEYNGAQHYLPIEFFGGKEGLELRKDLDRRKMEKCYENSVGLIEISYEEDFDYAFNELKAHIYSLLNSR